MGNIGLPEMIFVFVIALLVFGPKRLPELGKSLGKGIAEFRRATSGIKDSIEREIRNAETEADEITRPQPPSVSSEPADAPKS